MDCQFEAPEELGEIAIGTDGWDSVAGDHYTAVVAISVMSGACVLILE